MKRTPLRPMSTLENPGDSQIIRSDLFGPRKWEWSYCFYKGEHGALGVARGYAAWKCLARYQIEQAARLGPQPIKARPS